jgi:hypothetical protein
MSARVLGAGVHGIGTNTVSISSVSSPGIPCGWVVVVDHRHIASHGSGAGDCHHGYRYAYACACICGSHRHCGLLSLSWLCSYHSGATCCHVVAVMIVVMHWLHLHYGGE